MADFLQTIPAMETPPNVTSYFPTTTFDGPPWYYVATILSTIVSGTLLFLRLYTKLHVVRKVDLTDYFIVTSFVLLIVLHICLRICIGKGAGAHQWNISLHDLSGIGYWTYIYQIIYALTILLVKTALLLQYLRLFAPQKSINPFMWYSSRIMIVGNGIFYTLTLFIAIFVCSPREAFWNPLIKGSRCINRDIHLLFVCAYNILSDIIILMLPSRAVSKLKIPRSNKAKIVLLFAIGLLACVADAMMIFYITRIQKKNADLSYNTLRQGLWPTIEISFGIIVTCMITLPKFIKAKGPQIRIFCSSLTRPLKSFTSGSFGQLTHSNENITISQGMTVNTFDTCDFLAGDLPFANRAQDLENYHSPEDISDVNRNPSNKVTDMPHEV